MAKDWKVSQTATVNGNKETCSFILPNFESDDVLAFCGLLEGGYQITEVNETMSNMEKAETNATASNPVTYIGMYGEQNQSARISGFGGKPIHFKNTVSGDEIKNVLATVKPYPLVPTAAPQSVTIKLSERTL